MDAGKLSFGLRYSLQNPTQWAEPVVDKYAAAIKQIEWAETIGFDDVWLAEHHFLGDDHLASLLPMAAAIAARAKRIRIGTGILRKSGQVLLEDVPDVETLKEQGILQVVSPPEAVDAIGTYV